MNQPNTNERPRPYYGISTIFWIALAVLAVIGTVLAFLYTAFLTSPALSAAFVLLSFVREAVGLFWNNRQLRDFAQHLTQAHVAASAAHYAPFAFEQQQPSPSVMLPPRQLPPPTPTMPRSFEGNLPKGASGNVRTYQQGDNAPIEATAESIAAAIAILAAREQPTRSAFHNQGIHASEHVAACVAVLSAQGYAVAPKSKGSSATWAQGVNPEDAPEIAAHFRKAIPWLPVPTVAPAPAPVRDTPLSPAAGRQAAGQAGRKAKK